MEALDSKEVADWIGAQNKVTFDYLEKLPLREHFRSAHHRALELSPRRRAGMHEGDRYFFEKNSGLQRQAVVYMRARALTADSRRSSSIRTRCGRTARRRWRSGRRRPTDDCSRTHCRKAVPTGKSCKVRDVDSGTEWHDERPVGPLLRHFLDAATARASSIHDIPSRPKARCSKPRWPIRRSTTTASVHRSRPTSLVYARKDLPSWFVSGSATEDGRYLLIWLSKGADNSNRLYYADLRDPQRPAVDRADHAAVRRRRRRVLAVRQQGSDRCSCERIGRRPTGRCSRSIWRARRRRAGRRSCPSRSTRSRPRCSLAGGW